jgi:glycosyltransferase involved in cell wall biosynthesis
MSVSIITVANLGKKTNLKTPGILPVIEEFAQRGELKQVICQVNTGFHFSRTYSAIPSFIRYPFRIVEKLTGLSLRRLHHITSRYFTEWLLKPADIVFFHPPTRFKDAMHKAKQSGSTVVGIATVPHPLFDKDIFTEEYRRSKDVFDRSEFFERMGALVNRYDFIIAISDFVKSSYIKHGFPAEKIFVAYTDIPLPKVGKPSEKDLFIVLYVAYTSSRKGLQYLLEAWQNLRLTNARLVLVGGYSGEMPEKLREYCDRIIKNDPSIVWTGSVEDTSNYYLNANAFVLPSLSEGNPKAVMEAMAYGLPVVTTTNAQSIVEDGESGFVIPIRGQKAIKEKIQFFYDNPEKAREMGSAARKAMEHKKPFGEAVFEIYKEILKREKSRR